LDLILVQACSSGRSAASLRSTLIGPIEIEQDVTPKHHDERVSLLKRELIGHDVRHVVNMAGLRRKRRVAATHAR
jgi:hypothetical protein